MQSEERPVERASVPLSVVLDDPEFEAELLSPSPDALAADPALRAGIGDIPISSSIVIELPNPSLYTLPGDLLLITGLGLPTDRAELDAYVARLSRAGVPALVFGIEPVYSQVPEALVDACHAHGLPLVALPPHIYFAPLTAHINRALETERTRTLSAMNSIARRLTEAALQNRPAQRILAVLTQSALTHTAPTQSAPAQSGLKQSGAGFAMLRVGDEILSAGSVPASLDIDGLFGDLELRLGGAPSGRAGLATAFTAIEVEGTVFEITAHGSTAARRARVSEAQAILLLAREGRVTSTDRTAMLLAANLMELIVQLPAEQSMAVDQLLMHFMVESLGTVMGPSVTSSGARARVSRLLARSLGSSERSAHAVVAVKDPKHGGGPGETTVADVSWLRRLLHTPFVEHRSPMLRAFTATPPSASEFAQAEQLGWLLAVSSAHEFASLPQAMAQAEELARAALRLRRHIDESSPERAAPWPLSSVSDPALSRLAARRWLAPLDDESRSEEREVLHAWLREHGSWDRTARALGLHRNTVRRLVAVAAEALGSDLDDPVERARITLAFALLDDTGAKP